MSNKHTIDIHSPSFLKGVETSLARIRRAQQIENEEQIEAARSTAKDFYWKLLKNVEDDGSMPKPVQELIGQIQNVLKE